MRLDEPKTHTPQVHPSLLHAPDKFCPECGRLGEKLRDLRPPLEEWGCRTCEPSAFEGVRP